MAVEKTTYQKYEVTRYSNIQVATIDEYTEDGKVVGAHTHRHVLNPGDDTSGETKRIQDVAAVEWTAEVIATWEEMQAQAQADAGL